jgi:hypothetical protein
MKNQDRQWLLHTIAATQIRVSGLRGISSMVWYNLVWLVRDVCWPTEKRFSVDIEGIVCNGVIIPDDAKALPEGTRVRISPASDQKPLPFGERFAKFKGAASGLPSDLAKQHDHYRLGTPKQ